MKKLEKLTLKELGNSCLLLDSAESRGLIGGSGGCSSDYALSFLGNCEVGGSGANLNITSWLGTCTDVSQADALSDETPWCSAFVNAMMISAGGAGTNSAAASSWNNWGQATSTPAVGDVAVTSGHVGIITSIVNGVITMTSGNNGSDGCVSSYTISSANYNFRH